MVTLQGIDTFRSLDRAVGEGWCDEQRKASACDELLHCIIGNGFFTAKIDGFIHAASMTTPFIVKHIGEIERATDGPLSLRRLTTWKPTDSAMRYAHWQVDFHWKIDTRPWQYNLLLKFMRRSYESALLVETELSELDRQELLAANTDFWDAVEIAYTYRSEILERSRGYARHPDASAGSSDHGYSYFPVVPEPAYEFDKLGFELIGTGIGSDDPVGFPNLSEVTFAPPTEAARLWIRAAKEAGQCDEYLRLRLGGRFVPTRVDGWESALQDLVRYTQPDLSDPLVKSLASDLETAKRVLPLFFAQVQSEFGRRLGGLGRDALITLLETACPGVMALLAGKEGADQDYSNFVTIVAALDPMEWTQLRGDFRDLLDMVRPIHPRYAAFDPLEPLPWQTRNPERYQSRMRRLGYEL